VDSLPTPISGRVKTLLQVITLALLCCGVAPRARGVQLGGADDIAVVVAAASVPDSSVTMATVAGIYLRKRQMWHDHSRIVAVNLPATHPLRHDFSLRVLGRDPAALQAYWNKEYFHGVLPPIVLASEEAVMRFVAETPGAIGYVSNCMVDKRVAVVLLISNPAGASTACREPTR
jgi:ABC-type phosphate transport system substrate-binding protein